MPQSMKIVVGEQEINKPQSSQCRNKGNAFSQIILFGFLVKPAKAFYDGGNNYIVQRSDIAADVCHPLRYSGRGFWVSFSIQSAKLSIYSHASGFNPAFRIILSDG